MVIALTRCPATLDRTGEKEGKGKKKNTKATREREIYRTCRDETEMAEKPNKARDPIHSLIVIGGQPCMSGESFACSCLSQHEAGITLSLINLNTPEDYDKLSLKIDCLDYCTIEPFAIRPHYLLGPLFASGDFPS